MQTSQPRIATIVLNWNRKDDTLRCLASLQRSDYPLNDIYVVDNASTDDSVEAIRETFPNLRLVINEKNLGFAEGNNIVIQRALEASYDAVLLLNNDTVVATDAIGQLVGSLIADPTAGVASPAMYFLDRPDLIWSAGGSIDWRSGGIESTYYNRASDDLPESAFAVDHVSGCCMLVRADAIRQAGLLDPRFFMYYEETEWCVRIGRAGYRIVVDPRARIWHDISPDQQLGSPAIAYYMTRNQLLFLQATRAPLSAWVHTLYRQIRTLVSLFLKPASLARMKGRVPMVRAMRDFVLGRFGPAQVKRSVR